MSLFRHCKVARNVARYLPLHLESPNHNRIDSNACRVLWGGLPTVAIRDEFEGHLTLAELSDALSPMLYDKSRGIDGLIVEFYKKFWNLLGPAFVQVLVEAYETGEMPLSMRWAVNMLLPKKGDLGCLKNWRPGLADYKIVASRPRIAFTPSNPEQRWAGC